MKEIEERKTLESSDTESRIRHQLIREMQEEMDLFQQEVMKRLELDRAKLSDMLRTELHKSVRQLKTTL